MSDSKTALRRGILAVAAAGAILAGLAAVAQDDTAGKPVVSIRELMEKTITPASNTIWNAYEPPSDEDAWLRLEEAAVTMMVAAQVTAIGGTGPMDDEWARQPAWKAFNEVMLTASRDALAAIRARDHDALLAAGDVLYPPCEGCHQQFNPGVVDAAQ